MSPRHFSKAIYGPYYLSDKHYDQPKEPQTKFEKFTYIVFKYTGINKIIDLFQSPAPQPEEVVQPEEPKPIDLKALRERRRAAQNPDQ